MRRLFIAVLLALLTWCPQYGWASDGGGWPFDGPAEVLLGFGVSYTGPDGSSTTHHGIDVAADPDSRVQVVRAGTVTFAGSVPASGGGTMRAVTIDSGDVRISYLPLTDVAVSAGEWVEAGSLLGLVAASGDASSPQPHLHIGARIGSLYVDPARYLSAPLPVGGTEPAPTPEPVSAPEPAPAAPVVDAAPVAAPQAAGIPAAASPVTVPVGAGSVARTTQPAGVASRVTDGERASSAVSAQSAGSVLHAVERVSPRVASSASFAEGSGGAVLSSDETLPRPVIGDTQVATHSWAPQGPGARAAHGDATVAVERVAHEDASAEPARWVTATAERGVRVADASPETISSVDRRQELTPKTASGRATAFVVACALGMALLWPVWRSVLPPSLDVGAFRKDVAAVVGR